MNDSSTPVLTTPPPRRTFKRGWLFVVFAIIGLCILSLASTDFINRRVNAIYQETKLQQQQAAEDLLYTAEKQLLIEGQDNTWNVFGTAQPRITIVEFGDFTCPYCREVFATTRSVMLRHQDSVQFIYRDRTPNERSALLALTAHCAGEQGKFWQMHDKLFQYQSSSLGTNLDELNILAKSINLNLPLFQTCLTTQKYLDKIKNNLTDSMTLGANGTPTFFINGQKYQGTVSEADFEAIINELK